MAAEYSPVVHLKRIYEWPAAALSPQLDPLAAVPYLDATLRASDIVRSVGLVNDWLAPVTDYASSVLNAQALGVQFFEQHETMHAVADQVAALHRYELMPAIEPLSVSDHKFTGYPSAPTPPRRRDRRVTPVLEVECFCLACGQPFTTGRRTYDANTGVLRVEVPPACVTCVKRMRARDRGHLSLVTNKPSSDG